MEYETTERDSRVREIFRDSRGFLSRLGDGKLPSESGVTTLQG
jgi:hypothetical protein